MKISKICNSVIQRKLQSTKYLHGYVSFSAIPRVKGKWKQCVLLCFIKLILGNREVRSRCFIVSEPRETHPRSEIADVLTLPSPPLDNLGCPDPDPQPSPWLRRWFYRSPTLPLRTDPATATLTTRDLCPGGSVVWAGPKFVRPHWWRSWVMVRFLEIQGPNCREILHRWHPKQHLFVK